MQLPNHATAVEVDDGVLVRLARAHVHSARLPGERPERDPGFPCTSLVDLPGLNVIAGCEQIETRLSARSANSTSWGTGNCSWAGKKTTIPWCSERRRPTAGLSVAPDLTYEK